MEPAAIRARSAVGSNPLLFLSRFLSLFLLFLFSSLLLLLLLSLVFSAGIPVFSGSGGNIATVSEGSTTGSTVGVMAGCGWKALSTPFLGPSPPGRSGGPEGDSVIGAGGPSGGGLRWTVSACSQPK
jgi:hypothetical protein